MGGSPEQVEPCVEGMVNLYLNHHGSIESARELCGRLEASNQQTCLDSVEESSKLFMSSFEQDQGPRETARRGSRSAKVVRAA